MNNTPALMTAEILNELKASSVNEHTAKNAHAWILGFMNENADMLNRNLPMSHFMGMLITGAFVRVNAVNAGFYDVPMFAEAYAFVSLWTQSRPIPSHALNACKATFVPTYRQ
jgi:hypothetical protein